MSAKKFDIVNQFLGYVNKYDITNIKPGFLVEGSKNVRINTNGRIGIRKGYKLDGQDSSTIGGVKSAFDFRQANGNQRHLRSGQTLLQFRYVANAGDKYKTNTFTAGQVFWIDLKTYSATTDNFNYASWWQFSQGQQYALFVNGTSNIYEWSGGITTLASTTATTITKNGTTTWAEEGFYFTGTNSVIINGNTYSYTGGASTTTLTGVSPSPVGESANSVVFQAVKTTANSAMTSIPSTFKNNILGVLNNQLYVSATDLNSVYVSKTNDYTDYSFTAGGRLPGEGALFSYLDGIPTAMIPQESDLYISCANDFWFKTNFALSGDLTKENLTVVPLKTSANQGALNPNAVFNVKNSILFLNRETSLDELGRVQNIFAAPNAVNYSDPVKNLFNAYDFTDAQGVYWKYNLYISVPKEGIVLIYNLADSWWEAPQTMPVGAWSIIDGELYGHDYNSFKSYELFVGTNDNGFPIYATANFSYQNYPLIGGRSNTKSFTEQYVEGYISPNTVLKCNINYDIDGCMLTSSGYVDGQVAPFSCLLQNNSSLGQNPLGDAPLGDGTRTLPNLPPKFRKFITFPKYDFFEVQFSFSTTEIDCNWEILAFGGNIQDTRTGSPSFTQ